MKISQLSTDEATALLLEIMPFVDNLVSDEEFCKEIAKKTEFRSTLGDFMVQGAQKIVTLVPVILKNHKNDFYGIISAIYKIPPEKIGKQTLTETVNQVKELLKDEDLIGFFKLHGDAEVKK